MARWIQRMMLLTLAIGGLTALVLWWWLRRRPEEVILKTELGTISRVRGIGRPPAGPVPSQAEGPAQVSPVEGPVPSPVEGPVPSQVEGPAPSQVEGPAPSQVEGAPADDLKRIEGIGPKISNVLQDAGITTYAQLAATDVHRLRQILDESGIRLANPDTWPEQARLAAAGDWDALKRLQGQLKGGRRV
jgi:predicted flap endonuclease-1-like 5' DNA nuclease